MDIMKIIGVGVVGAILAVTVKEYKPEFAIGVVIITGIIMFLYAADGIRTAFSDFEQLIGFANIDAGYFNAIVKVTGIAYISEYGAEICRDSGYSAIAVKIEFAGKICIMLITIPVISAFLKICMETVRMVW